MDYQRIMKEDRDRLLKKWSPFLEGIEDEYTVENTAILLENEARYLTEAPGDGHLQTGDVQGLQKIMLPIVRRVFPNLIANNLVSVQPIAAPSGIIFYLKYQFGTERPGLPANGFTGPGQGIGGLNGSQANPQTAADYPEYSMYQDENGVGFAGYNPYYSSDEIGPFTVEAADVADDGTIVSPDTSAFHTNWPMEANSAFGTIEVLDSSDGSADTETEQVLASYSFAYEGSWVVRGADKLQTTSAFEVAVDGTTGAVTVTNRSGSAKSLRVQAWYKTDMEFTENIPEMRITIASIPVVVKTRKLKAMWSQESEQDLKAYHGLSADAELTALVSNEMIAEIDREIIQKCLSITPATSRFTYDWNSFAANNTTGNYLDTHMALMQRVTRASNEVFRKSKIGPANWMVVGTKVASYVEVLKGFIPNPVTASMGMNIVKAGTYAGKFDIYKDPLFPDDVVLMGHKSPQSPFGAGIVYSPYVTNLTPVIVGENDFNPRRGFLARYGLTQVPHGQLLYSMIRIKNLP